MFCNVYIISLTITGLIYFYFKRKYSYWTSKGVPCVPTTLFFGNLLEIIRGKEQAGKYIAKLYNNCTGPYFGFYAFTKPFLIIKDPQIIKRVLIKDFHVFPNRVFACEGAIDPVMSYSLIGIKAPHWKDLRNKLSPAFTSKKMKSMLQSIVQCGEIFKTHIETIVDKNVDVKELSSGYTTNAIASCAFGIDAASFVGEMKMLKKKKASSVFPAKLTSLSYIFAHLAVKLFKFKFFELGDYMKNIFVKIIEQREKSQLRRNDFVDVLLDLKRQGTENDEFKFEGGRLVAQAIMLFVAGHESTSSTIAFALHELSVHADVQERLRQEIEDVIQTHGDLSYEAIQDMKYLQMVISETLRKYPLTPFIHRECVEDYVIPETGLVLQRGTPVIIPQHGLHWDADYFPNPENFDPERFNDENKYKITPYAYVPFGDGPRNCIGERFALISTKVGLIYVLRNFKAEMCSKTKKQLVFQASSLLRAEGGVQLVLRKLQSE